MLSGPALAVGLVTLAVLAAQLPVVACSGDGVITGTPLWLAGGGASGSGSGSSDSDVHSGTVTLNGTTFTYACQGDHLLRFSG